jgi:hypothetical protein
MGIPSGPIALSPFIIYCEHEMGRIWHPITKKFHGRYDFEEFARDYYSNNKLVKVTR